MYKSSFRLHNSAMATMSVSSARKKLSDAVHPARMEAVILERYGRPSAVLVSPEQYEKMMDAVDDVDAFDAAMAEEGENIPWDQVKADLGWV